MANFALFCTNLGMCLWLKNALRIKFKDWLIEAESSFIEILAIEALFHDVVENMLDGVKFHSYWQLTVPMLVVL